MSPWVDTNKSNGTIRREATAQGLTYPDLETRSLLSLPAFADLKVRAPRFRSDQGQPEESLRDIF